MNRKDFISIIDSNKIWNKELNIKEINTTLETLEKSLKSNDFQNDSDFLMNGRRSGLKKLIQENFNNSNYNNPTDAVLESLFNFWEFINDEYNGSPSELVNELHLTPREIDDISNRYREKGIISLQEKNELLDMINTIKEYINTNNLI